MAELHLTVNDRPAKLPHTTSAVAEGYVRQNTLLRHRLPSLSRA